MTIKNKIFFEVVGFKQPNEMASFYQEYIETLEEATNIADNLFNSGYYDVIIRKEIIVLRDEHHEYSSSSPIKIKKSKKELEIKHGNAWLRSLGHLDNDFEFLIEYAPGQLDWAIKNIDSLIDWDEWQTIQALMGKTMSFEDAMNIHNMLWENDIEPMELETDASIKYYSEIEGI